MYPALAVLQALEGKADVLWVGGEGGMEAELVSRAGLAYREVPAGAVHGVGLKALQGLWQLARGYFAAGRILREFKPDAMFFTGGFVAIPTGLAGRNVPTLLYVPDIEPALALKMLARFADLIAVTADASRTFFSRKKKVVVTGYPTRADLKRWDRAEAFNVFDLNPDKRTLFVFGGSKGAQSINRALVAALPELLRDMQVIHVSGKPTWPEVDAARAALPAELAANYRAYPYLHDEMGAAFTIADLVVSRAGASVLGEFPQFGLPAILVPYPYAWRYQKVNADYLAERGAAIVVRDEDLSAKLSATVRELMFNAGMRDDMRAAMRKLAKPDAARVIADLLVEMSR